MQSAVVRLDVRVRRLRTLRPVPRTGRCRSRGKRGRRDGDVRNALFIGLSQETHVENAVTRAVSDAIDANRLREAVSMAVEGEVISTKAIQSR